MTIHQTLLDSIAKLYDVSLSQLQPVAGGHFSHVYEYTDHHRACILRITPPNMDVDLLSMRARLEWLTFLSAHDGPVPRPVRSRNGNLIELMKYEDQVYIAGAFEKAPGVLAEGMSHADWSNELFQALGRTLGHCHRVAQIYVPARAEFKCPEWDCAENCFNPKEELVGADRAILEKRAQVLSLIQSLPKDRDGYGLAHLDLHFGNFFVDVTQQRILLFDFDDCAYGWYIMDIAMLLFDALVVYTDLDRQQFGERFLENVLRGYCTQIPISQFWVSQLPHFLKLLEIGVYVMLYRAYDPATADEWVNKFMSERRYRIEQEMPYVDLDFKALYSKTMS
jgi:Ser/Thr protein kinase RdoA (MazF antagonist)